MATEPASHALSNPALVQRTMERVPRGLITDVDGTISEIAALPELATISRACRRHLRALSSSFDLVAIVSGRPLLEVRRMVALDGLDYVGNHGLERWQQGRIQVASAARRVAEALPALVEHLEVRLRHVAGLHLERKAYGLAIHYRAAARPWAARRAILSAVAQLSDATLFSVLEGRRVVEVRPRGRIDKGWAVRALVRRHGLGSVVYLGDDLTDLDAFRAVQHLRRRHAIDGVAIAVADDETPPEVIRGADLYLNGVAEAELFLKSLRQPLAGRR